MLPKILNLREFVNADNIAASLSLCNVESVALAVLRIILHKINDFIKKKG